MMDWEKRQFKRDELAWELRDEDAEIGAYNKYNAEIVEVHIDGKFWKTMPRIQAEKAGRTLVAKGKNVKIIVKNA